MACMPKMTLDPLFAFNAMLVGLGCSEARRSAIALQQKAEQREFEFFALYERPRDYPSSFVIRRWEFADGGIVAKPDPNVPCVVAPSLAVARTCLGAMRHGCQLSRFELNETNEVDQVIKEVWF